MAKIIIDGKPIECRDGINVLQAALETGVDIPHYCYHPALAVVASCRLCLMEMKMPNPKTREMEWAPKLVPSCQTPIRNGMEVRFNSPAVKSNQEHVMEYYLLNHPLDCPVCDKAGECFLQDYSYRFGSARSRVVDPKHKNPKKDIGPKTLLYQDRCVLCSRCVRFAKEVAGTGELCIVNRGNRAEIDVFPGVPLSNPIQGNVVDLCPVGALLDKSFLFRQRVWFLKEHKSICRGCSSGCAIFVDEREHGVYRLRPRWNPGVNDWWMCDEGRFGWDFVKSADRISSPRVRRGQQFESATWESIPEVVRQRFEQLVAKHGPGSVAAQFSPEMSCEEVWLLGSFLRSIAPEAALTVGDVQIVGEDQRFPLGANGGTSSESVRQTPPIAMGGLGSGSSSGPTSEGGSSSGPISEGGSSSGPASEGGSSGGPTSGGGSSGGPACDPTAGPAPKFIIHAEKNPNRRGVEVVLRSLGGKVITREQLLAGATKGDYKALWIVGGYPKAGWPSKELATAAGKAELLVVQDIFDSALTAAAHIVLPFCAWVEREGSFVNAQGLLQPFERAVRPPDGAMSDGQYLWSIAGHAGLFRAERVREMMAGSMPECSQLHVPPEMPKYQH